MLRELHLFAGAGGGILGGILLGHRTVCAVEIEPYRRACLLQRQRDGILPWFPIWDDIGTFDGKPWKGIADIVCIGSPCQGFSTSGKMLGLSDPRSALLIHAIRVVSDVRPRRVLLENTPEIVLGAAGYFAGEMAKMGYDTRNGIIGACCAGLEHMRKRFWMVADSVQERRQRVVREWIARIETFGTRTATYANSPTERISRLEERLGKPGVLGTDDGLAHRVDRLESIGDGQIPSVVKLAWETLSK